MWLEIQVLRFVQRVCSLSLSLEPELSCAPRRLGGFWNCWRPLRRLFPSQHTMLGEHCGWCWSQRLTDTEGTEITAEGSVFCALLQGCLQCVARSESPAPRTLQLWLMQMLAPGCSGFLRSEGEHPTPLRCSVENSAALESRYRVVAAAW